MISFLFFIFAAALHSVGCHLVLFSNRVIGFLLIGFIVGAFLSIYMILISGFNFAYIVSILLYGFFCEFYIFLFTMVGSSVSASLLISLLKDNIKEIDIENISKTKKMLRSRIQVLVKTGLLIQKTDCYSLSTKGYFLNKIFLFLRHFFNFQSQAQSIFYINRTTNTYTRKSKNLDELV
jgi:hypothetical protein